MFTTATIIAFILGVIGGIAVMLVWANNKMVAQRKLIELLQGKSTTTSTTTTKIPDIFI